MRNLLFLSDRTVALIAEYRGRAKCPTIDINGAASDIIYRTIRAVAIEIQNGFKLSDKGKKVPLCNESQSALLSNITHAFVLRVLPHQREMMMDDRINRAMVQDLIQYFKTQIINEIWGSVYYDVATHRIVLNVKRRSPLPVGKQS